MTQARKVDLVKHATTEILNCWFDGLMVLGKRGRGIELTVFSLLFDDFFDTSKNPSTARISRTDMIHSSSRGTELFLTRAAS